MTNEILLFSPKLCYNAQEVGIGKAMSRSTVNIITVASLGKNEDTDIGHRAQIHKLLDPIFYVSFVDCSDQHTLKQNKKINKERKVFYFPTHRLLTSFEGQYLSNCDVTNEIDRKNGKLF